MKKIHLLLVALLLLTGCGAPTLKKHNEQMFDLGFDTVVQLLAYTENLKEYNEYKETAREVFLHYNQLFDRYSTYDNVNNIKTINDQAGIAPVKVDADIIDLLKLAKEYSELSKQQYNVTYGAVLEIWHNYREEAERIPSLEELKAAQAHTGWDNIIIDEEAQTVFITDKEASLDVGSIAKGYATEKVAQKLIEQGLQHAIINAGGNVRIIGEKPEDSTWSVGIQLPNASQDASLATVYIDADQSFVTSGDYQRAYIVNGKSYHHIIDPNTLMPSSYMRSVTIVTKDSGIADILSTTLFTLSYEDGNALLQKLRDHGMEVEAVWVFDATSELPKDVESVTSNEFKLVISEGLSDNIKLK